MKTSRREESKVQSGELEEHSPGCFIQTHTLGEERLRSVTGLRKHLMKSSGCEIPGSNILKITVGCGGGLSSWNVSQEISTWSLQDQPEIET